MKPRGLLMRPELAALTYTGDKTQTRRICGLGLVNKNPGHWKWTGQNTHGDFLFESKCEEPEQCFEWGGEGHCPGIIPIKAEYGQAGQVFYIREAFRTMTIHDHLKPKDIPETAPIEFLDRPIPHYGGKTRPGLFMPKWAARSVVRAYRIKIHRVQDMTNRDAMKEGIDHKGYDKAIVEYSWLWNKINSKLGMPWEFNPWVWAIYYRKEN